VDRCRCFGKLKAWLKNEAKPKFPHNPVDLRNPDDALGLLTFIGWISGLPLLASVCATYIPMAPSTAFCFSLIGIRLIVHLLRAALASSSLRLTRSRSGVREIGQGF
jgi:hypothetical protein